MLLKSICARIFIVNIFIILTVFEFGTIKLPVIISDSMVFHRNTKFSVYGCTSEKEKVTFTFDVKKYSTRDKYEGNWSHVLPASPFHTAE